MEGDPIALLPPIDHAQAGLAEGRLNLVFPIYEDAASNKPTARDEVPPQLLSSREFQDACPSTAVCMRLVMLA